MDAPPQDLKTSSTGAGSASSGGTPASVGHSYAFGNTEEKARRLNMGCKARGQPGQPFSHKTGHGYVKAHRGFYHDAIFCLLYTSPSPRDRQKSRMPSSA